MWLLWVCDIDLVEAEVEEEEANGEVDCGLDGRGGGGGGRRRCGGKIF